MSTPANGTNSPASRIVESHVHFAREHTSLEPGSTKPEHIYPGTVQAQPHRH